MITEKETSRELPVPLSDQQLKALGESCADLVKKIYDLEDRKKLRMQVFKKRIDTRKVELREVAAKLREKTEPKVVKCIERRDSDTRLIELIRTDTQEVIESRAYAASDMQMTLEEARRLKESAEKATSEKVTSQVEMAIGAESAVEPEHTPDDGPIMDRDLERDAAMDAAVAAEDAVLAAEEHAPQPEDDDDFPLAPMDDMSAGDLREYLDSGITADVVDMPTQRKSPRARKAQSNG